ncbi:hypothetical protein DRW07_12935 [Alteromonas sediminis]|uniref:Uncharacterized protein n=1 Tax=Alteromonas sediminis TaxID=2259342 RepID=A0A3N5Y010_9ALTE|nr:hypothetical protein [Alteromonas sediminis]RPJ65716.1 hypothetical protein DRW07_12935 [Alteromonas sediminis]
MEAQSNLSHLADILTVTNAGAFHLSDSLLGTGIPLQKGLIWHIESIELIDAATSEVFDAAFTPITLWPDGSIKWLGIKTLIALDAKQQKSLYLRKAKVIDFHSLTYPIQEKGHCLHIATGEGEIIVDKRKLLNISTPSITGSSLEYLFAEPVSHLDEAVVECEFNVYRSKHHYICAEITQIGVVTTDIDKQVKVTARTSINLINGDIDVAITITNPAAAVHPNGKWDLGDPNSINIKAINWCFKSAHSGKVSLKTSESAQWQLSEGKTCLHQASSGGDDWLSPIHVDKSNKVNLPFKGYKLVNNGHATEQGDTASPSLRVEGESAENMSFITPDLFWQNFPSQLLIEEQRLSLSLLGAESSPPIELQPGEQKTRTFTISHTEGTCRALLAKIDPDYVASTHAIASMHGGETDATLNQLINVALDGKAGFEQKNKSVDMFGWRNFGELYADHERALDKDSAYFISHYNNQYDPIFGMLSQWLKTGDRQWFVLADHLAKHVADIDIYHTKDDKPEYSGGLFWHTDHYVQAYTATHRTYSANQPSNVYDDHAGGGGPGGQHCYTQGLALHYLLTQYPPSKQAVLKLCQWVKTVYEGDNTLMALVLACRNRSRSDLKDVITGQYPLDRGTANYINALIDSYEVTGKQAFMGKAENVILSTFSYRDDLASRDLSNVENTWFYTVFCQSVCRYLSVLQTHSDNAPCAATIAIINSLLHYGKWMIEHEYLYLDKADILEFPNQTWTAQDCRKLCVLSFILPFLSQSEKGQCQEKITRFKQGIYTRLSSSEETKTTRVLCLLMQNAHYAEYEKMGLQCFLWSQHNLERTDFTYRTDTFATFFKNTLLHFSLSRERRQLVRRFPQLQRFLGKP